MALAWCTFSVIFYAVRLHAAHLEVKPREIAISSEDSPATPSAVDVTIKFLADHGNLALLQDVVLNLGDGSAPRNCTKMEFSALCRGISLSRTGSFPAELIADSNSMGHIILHGFESPPARHLQPDHYSLAGGDTFTLELLNTSQLPIDCKPHVRFNIVDPQCNMTISVSANVVLREGRVYLHGLSPALIQESFGPCTDLHEKQVLVSYSLNNGSQVVIVPRLDNQPIMAKKVRPFKIYFFFPEKLDANNGYLSAQNRARVDLAHSFGGRIDVRYLEDIINWDGPDVCGAHCTGEDGWCPAMEGCPASGITHNAYIRGKELFDTDMADMIVGTTWKYWMDMKQLAVEHPSKWVLFTSTSNIPGQYFSPNFAHVHVREYQATYMMGYTLGRHDSVRSNPRIGYVGSFDSTKDRTSAFVKGVWEGLGRPAEIFIVYANAWNSARRSRISAERLFQFFNVTAIFTLLDGDYVSKVAKTWGGVSVGNNLDLMPIVGESVLASKVFDLSHMLGRYVEAAISGLPWGSQPPADHPAATSLALHSLPGRDQMGWRMLTYSPRLGRVERKEIEARELRFAEGFDDIFCNTLQQESTGAAGKQLWGGALGECIDRANADWGNFWTTMNIRDRCDSGYGQFDGKCFLGPLDTTSDVPDRCPPGMILNVLGCEPCPKGTFRLPDNDEGHEACVKCKAGYYAPNPGSQTCLPAQAGTFVRERGSSNYTNCAVGTFETSAASTECSKCLSGTYADIEGSSKCKACPPGADCSSGFDAVAQNGYWKTSDGKYLQCTIPGACEGGTQICAKGMHGPLCSGCDLGWTHSKDVCIECPDFEVNAFFIFVTCVVYAVYIGIMVFITKASSGRKRGVGSVVLKLFTTYIQIQSIGLSVALTEAVSLTYIQGVASSPDKAFMKLDCLLRDSMFSVDSNDGHSSYAETWMLVAALALIPAAIIVAMIIFLLHQYMKKVPLPESVGAFLMAMVPQFIIICFVLHPTVTNRVVTTGWKFQQIDGKFVLNSNPDVEWTSNDAIRNRLLSGLGLFVFVLGIPLTLLTMLWRKSDKLGFGKTKRMLGFLYTGYEHRCWYWEVVVMLRKALLVAAANAIGWTSLAKAMRLLSIGLLSLALHLLFQPFDDREFAILDSIESWSLCAFITFPLGRLIYELEFSPEVNAITVPIIWGITILFQLRVIYLVIWSFIQRQFVDYIEQRARNKKTMPPWYLRRFLVGRVRVHMDGTLDCSGLSASERDHLMSILKNALGCTKSANAVFSTEVFRQVLQCTAGRLLRAKLTEKLKEATAQREQEEADQVFQEKSGQQGIPVGVVGRFLEAYVKRRIKRNIIDLSGSTISETKEFQDIQGGPPMSLCQDFDDSDPFSKRKLKLEEVAKTSVDFCTAFAVRGCLPLATVHEFYNRLSDVIEDIEAGCLVIGKVKMRVAHSPLSNQTRKRPSPGGDGRDEKVRVSRKSPENEQVRHSLGFTPAKVTRNKMMKERRDAGVQVDLAVEEAGVAVVSQLSTSQTDEAWEIKARPARDTEIEVRPTNMEEIGATCASAGETGEIARQQLPQSERGGAELIAPPPERLRTNAGEEVLLQAETPPWPASETVFSARSHALDAEGLTEEATSLEQSLVVTPLCDPPQVWVDLGDYDEQAQEQLFLAINGATQAA